MTTESIYWNRVSATRSPHLPHTDAKLPAFSKNARFVVKIAASITSAYAGAGKGHDLAAAPVLLASEVVVPNVPSSGACVLHSHHVVDEFVLQLTVSSSSNTGEQKVVHFDTGFRIPGNIILVKYPRTRPCDKFVYLSLDEAAVHNIVTCGRF